MAVRTQETRKKSESSAEEIKDLPERRVGRVAVEGATQEETASVINDIEETVEDTKTTPDIENLLDEIDSLLEPNAQEFVAAFVQVGGQ